MTAGLGLSSMYVDLMEKHMIISAFWRNKHARLELKLRWSAKESAPRKVSTTTESNYNHFDKVE